MRTGSAARSRSAYGGGYEIGSREVKPFESEMGAYALSHVRSAPCSATLRTSSSTIAPASDGPARGTL